METLISVWSWGLISSTDYVQFQLGYENNTIFLTSGIFITLLEVVSINILFIITYRIWKKNIDVFNVRIFSLISAIILILSPIFHIIGAYNSYIEWSELYTPTLGFIIPFISAFFALITIILANKYVKE
ncbi:MAG: hypothetical protein ACFFBP_04395 [Promethearchaeota archaeon]